MKILVITDGQVEFIDESMLGSKEAQNAVPEIVNLIENGYKGEKYDVVMVTHDTHPEDYLSTQEGKRLPVIHGQEGTYGYQIHPAIKAALDKNYPGVMTCPCYVKKDRFGSLTLGERLRTRACTKESGEGDEIHFCGYCTGICVISNMVIAKANCPEARICLVEKASACVTPETHMTAVKAMQTMQMDIL